MIAALQILIPISINWHHIPEYVPNELEIQIPSLQAYYQELVTASSLVNTIGNAKYRTQTETMFYTTIKTTLSN